MQMILMTSVCNTRKIICNAKVLNRSTVGEIDNEDVSYVCVRYRLLQLHDTYIHTYIRMGATNVQLRSSRGVIHRYIPSRKRISNFFCCQLLAPCDAKGELPVSYIEIEHKVHNCPLLTFLKFQVSDGA